MRDVVIPYNTMSYDTVKPPSNGWVRRACDDAPLSVPVRLCDAPYLLSVATHAMSVRLGSRPLRDEIEAIRYRLPKTGPDLAPRKLGKGG